ncbi:MAG: lipid-binding SYLF domain-containing protein [Acidobacteriota bacterium]|nr:lipid-binding SYLF domain-containing protein [Acidobacteriota bacterium]MDW3229568.1 lipid-binding SYLF domain-containing protein [Acidobacteriota bacterium]MDY0231371.1 lipid-binding SYLF domain-containing protein [Candidatus Saccharicenans sp.]
MEKIARSKRAILFFIILFLGLRSPQLAVANKPDSKQGEERIARAIEVIKELTSLKEEGIPISLLKKAEGLAIIPGVVKAAWGLGGQYGKGLAVAKMPDGRWSNPLFINLAGGSLGFQAGVQKADVVLVFKRRRSVEELAGNKITLGTDLSVAAGPVGRSAEASTDLELEAEIYSYSKSKGLFAGISLKGSTIKLAKDANKGFYGPDINPEKILTEMLKAPEAAEELRQTLRELVKNTN